jgi:hypothetical protein
MRTDLRFDRALADMIDAWDRAEEAPRDAQQRRRALELTAIFVAVARETLDRPAGDPSATDP